MEGVVQNVVDVNGLFDVSGSSSVVSGVAVGGGPDPAQDSGTVENLPVAYSIDLRFSTDDGDYEISGSGIGLAALSFATWAPSNNVVLQTGASYEFTPVTATAVPEPSTMMIWVACFAMATFYCRWRRPV